MSRRQASPALDQYILEHGGEVHYDDEGKHVDFPESEQPAAPEWGGTLADQIDRAIVRAQEYGTRYVRLWRDRGEGWYAAESHDEHPGFSYICQIDEQTGQPIRCECAAAVICHHLGSAIQDWRERVGWYIRDAKAQAAIDDFGAEFIRPVAQRMEEEW